MREILLYFANKYFGEWERIYSALETKEEVDFEVMKKLAKKNKGRYITILDEEYPDRLKEVDKPPFVLFYFGDIKLLEEESIWPIQALRKCDTKKYMNSLIGSVTVHGYSSFLEKDILDNAIGKNILVKDGGIDNELIISRETEQQLVKSGGLVISEYPGYVIPSERNWRMSNRVKIGISRSLLLINSIKERGLFSIIGQTLREGRDVFCIPNTGVKGDHNDILISKGAKPFDLR